MKWTSRIKLSRLAKWLIPILIVAIVVLSLVTYYGTMVGNYVVNVRDANDRGDANLALSEYADLSAPAPMLSAKGLKDQAECTRSVIPDAQLLIKNIGSMNDEELKSYVAFSFHLINRSGRAVDYTYTFNFRSDDQNVYKAIRIWLIESTMDNEIRSDTIYGSKKTDEELAEYKAAIGGNYYETVDFVSEKQVCDVKVTGMPDNVAYKYTVVVWLEGYDPYCNDSLLGATLKATMDFVAE